jgi:cytochrome c oxidase subunit 2
MKLRLFGLILLGICLLAQPALTSGQTADPDGEIGDPAVGTAADQTPPETEPPVEEEAPEVEPPAEEEHPVKLIKMYAEEWKWTPDLIRVPVGTKLRIEFLSYGATRKFDLKGYKIKVLLPQDKPVSVEFVADKKGTFRWRCARPCGDGCAKMTGKLIVE